MRAGCKLSVGNIIPAPKPMPSPSSPALLAAATSPDEACLRCAVPPAVIAPMPRPTSAPPPARRPPSQVGSNIVGSSVPTSAPYPAPMKPAPISGGASVICGASSAAPIMPTDVPTIVPSVSARPRWSNASKGMPSPSAAPRAPPPNVNAMSPPSGS